MDVVNVGRLSPVRRRGIALLVSQILMSSGAGYFEILPDYRDALW